MLNPDNVTPIKPNPTSDQTKDMRSVRPSAPPQSNKNFSKIVERDDNRRSNDEDGVHGSDEKEETPSLFDLSAKKKPQIKINAQLKSNPDTTTETEDAVFNEDALQENEPAPSNLSSPSSLDKIKKTLPFLPQENSDMALNENEETPNAPSNDRMALNSPSNDQMAALNAPSNDQMGAERFPQSTCSTAN